MNASSEICLPIEPAALATEAVRRFGDRLERLIRSKIGRKLRPRVDAADVLQSAYRSFFLAAGREKLRIEGSEDLWKVLQAFATHKLQRQIEWHGAAKRSYQRETAGSGHLTAQAVRQMTPSEALRTQELATVAAGGLSDAERVALELLQRGWSRERIATDMRMSPRTIRRLLASCENLLCQQLLGDAITEPNAATDTPLKYSDYVLEKLVGAGGMGKVFRARDKVSGSVVAVKALHKSRQRDPRAVRRFVQEAQILERLSHPGIVRVQGLGQFPSGGHFMVMDYLDATDIATHLIEGTFATSLVCEVMHQIAEAISHAHEHGVIHGDLKPANVMLDVHGKVTVTDFGFAHLLHPAGFDCSSVGGTIGYMAPELLNGHGVPTPASDVYSLGKVIMDLLGSVRTDQVALRSYSSLETIGRRCLAVRPQDRFRDVRELLEELSELREHSM